ncbi:hypothetical protein TNCV_865221 [Trichonephila clavipes]|nr:hypothetical protein TNCV_865221 [Trichonephila clavipes]
MCFFRWWGTEAWFKNSPGCLKIFIGGAAIEGRREKEVNTMANVNNLGEWVRKSTTSWREIENGERVDGR